MAHFLVIAASSIIGQSITHLLKSEDDDLQSCKKLTDFSLNLKDDCPQEHL